MDRGLYMLRKYILSLLMCFFAVMMMAEDVTNARAEQVESTIVITYDLSKASNIRLLMSTDMSSHFVELKKVSGSVGKNVAAGSNRVITWYPLEEYDSFVADNVRFKVETYSGHEYVDLGLSVKWATCNIGANKPEEYGDYFAWGETAAKSYYFWNTYKYCNGTARAQTKYNTNSNYGIVDNKTQLNHSDDVAHAKWGDDWRMPTDAEWTELREQCTWTWTALKGVNGYKVTSKRNGKSIFLPASGYYYERYLYNAGTYGNYWSKSLSTQEPCSALFVYFSSSSVFRNYTLRCEGRSVRPVCP